MAETNKAKFVQTDFILEFKEHRFEFTGMFSEYGITKLHLVSRPPPHVEIVFGHEANIRMGSLLLKGLLIKQFTELGSSFEIRFLQLNAAQKYVLKERIEREGVHPGWARKYPRISVKEAMALGLPALSFCVMRFLGAENFSTVLNFTLDGIRVEVSGEEMTDARVGAIVHFDLMTNTDRTIGGLSGEIRNITVNEYEEDGKKQCSRSIGIKIVSMSLDQRQTYSDLIKDHCEIVKKQLAM